MNEIQFEGRVISSRWKILTLQGSGSFGKVFLVWDIDKQEHCAMKIEENKNDDKLKAESKILMSLSTVNQRRQGIPLMHWYGTDTNFSQLNFMVTDMLGPNLEDLFTLCNRKFSLKTVLMIAEGALGLIEYIHEKSIIHRDIKPENFLVGINNNSHLLFIIDFGLSQKYRDSNTHSHITFKENRPLVGTARYMSLNNHLGIEASRRDDLESLGYMLIYFMNGSLPWQGIDSPNKQEKYERIKEKKMKTQIESYCKNLPPEFTVFLNFVRNLMFDEKPDYMFLSKLFDDLFKKMGYARDFKYDWTDSTLINEELISKKTLPFGYFMNEIEEEDEKNSNFSLSDEKQSLSVNSVSNKSATDENKDKSIEKTNPSEISETQQTNGNLPLIDQKMRNIGRIAENKESIFKKMKNEEMAKNKKVKLEGFEPDTLMDDEEKVTPFQNMKKTERSVDQNETNNLEDTEMMNSFSRTQTIEEN